jgi:hypothetical protein
LQQPQDPQTFIDQLGPNSGYVRKCATLAG